MNSLDDLTSQVERQKIRLCAMFRFLSRILGVKTYALYVVKEDGTSKIVSAYDGIDVVYVLGGAAYRKAPQGDNFSFAPNQLNCVFAKKYIIEHAGKEHEELVFEKGTIVFDDEAKAEINRVDESKMIDRIGEQIWYEGIDKFRLPMTPATLVTIIFVAVIILMFLFVFMQQFPGIIGSITNFASQKVPEAAAAAVNATKAPIVVG